MILRCCWLAAACAAFAAIAVPSRADRLVLAPRGKIVLPGDAMVVYSETYEGPFGRRIVANVGVPQPDLGLELDLEQSTLGGTSRCALGLQYSIIGEAFTNNIAPALSVGARDLLNGGVDGRAVYVAMTKTFGLSVAQERIIRDVKLTGGWGTHVMGGAYIGLQVRALGVSLSGEVLARKLNFGVSLPLGPVVSLRGESLNGTGMAGVAVTLRR